jgi:hypothetical protein
MPTSAEGKVNKGIRGKGKLYIAFAIAAALAVPFLAELKGRISADTTHLLYGILIGLALVFLAAGTRAVIKPTSRSQT